jgi:UDP-glucose 4-epimerase
MGSYLVTGGAGFIGSHLVERLLADGHRVRVLDNLSTGRIENLPREAQLVEADVRSRAAIAAALDGVEGVFHLAAVASVVRCNEAWRDCHEINLGATVTLLDVCRDCDPTLPVVYASSAAVYGEQETSPLHERLTPAPLGPYGADKAACELQARAAANVHGMRTFGLRFFNVFGPRQAPDDAYAGVITIFRGRARLGLPMKVHGDGLQSRDFVHVGDVVECLMRAMASLGVRSGPCADVANVATGRATTIRELAEVIAARWGTRPVVVHGPERPGEIRHSLGSVEHLQRLLDFRPNCSLRAGLETLS